jgi:outer membrane protein TolC
MELKDSVLSEDLQGMGYSARISDTSDPGKGDDMRAIPWLMGICLIVGGCAQYRTKPISLDDLSTVIDHRTLDSDMLNVAAQHLESAQLFTGIECNLDVEDGITLDEAFLIALVYNPDLNANRQIITEQAGMIVSAAAMINPKWSSKVLSDAGSLRGESSLTIDVLSFLNMAKRPARRDIADAEALRVRLIVTSAEWDLYYRLLCLYEQYSFHVNFTVQLDELIQEFTTCILYPARQMAKVGSIPLRDLREIDGTLGRFEMQLLQNENTRRSIRDEIHETIGFPPGSRIEPQLPDPGDSGKGLSLQDSSRLADLALQSRPDLQVLLAEYRVVENRYRLAVLEQYPDVNLGPAVNFSSMDAFFGIAAQLIVPVFYRNRGEIERAFAKREEVRYRVETRLLGIQHEIQEHLRQMDYCTNQIKHISNRILPEDLTRLEASLAEMRFYPAQVKKAAALFRGRYDSWMQLKGFELTRITAEALLRKSTGLTLVHQNRTPRDREE